MSPNCFVRTLTVVSNPSTFCSASRAIFAFPLDHSFISSLEVFFSFFPVSDDVSFRHPVPGGADALPLQYVSKFLPLIYAIDALRKVMVLGVGLSGVAVELLLLVAISVVTIALGVPLFDRAV